MVVRPRLLQSPILRNGEKTSHNPAPDTPQAATADPPRSPTHPASPPANRLPSGSVPHTTKRFEAFDLVVLAEALSARFGAALPELVLDAAQRLCLAPELRRLIRKTTDWADLPAEWLDLAERLKPFAEQEKAARRSGDRKPPEVLFGFPLDAMTSPEPEIRPHRFALGEIARTPVGNFLLLAEPEMTQELYEAAMAEAERLAGQGLPLASVPSMEQFRPL